MSERWQVCPSCDGTGKFYKKDLILHLNQQIPCGRCGGTGFEGDAMEEKREFRERVRGEHLLHPLEKAILAAELAAKKKKK